MIRRSGRALAIALLALAALALVQLAQLGEAWAQNLGSAPVIFDVRRSLPLEPNEPVYHDFYINAGPESGMKKGMFITVVRQVPVHDPIQNKQQAILNVTVGKLQVIQVDRGITVARLHSELGDDERPTLEYEAVMIGDKIDLAQSSMDAPKTSGKKKVKAAESEAKPKSEAGVRAELRVEAKPEPAAPAAAEAPAKPAVADLSAKPAPSVATNGNSGGSTAAQAEAASSSPKGDSVVNAGVDRKSGPAAAKAAVTAETEAQGGSAVASVKVAKKQTSENASPASAAPGMVRIPVPAGDGSTPRKL